MVVVLIVAAGAAWESAVLSRLSARHGIVVLKRCVDVDELLAASTAGQADVAVVALDAPGLDHAAVELLHRHRMRVVALAAAVGMEVAAGRAARLGITAVVPDDDLDRVTDLVEAADDPLASAKDPSLLPRGRSADDAASEDELSASEPGRVIVVWGPGGAPGRTTVACSVAATLARRGLRTTLVDADPYGGAVAQHLGILDEVSGLLSAARLTGDGALEARFGSVQRALGDRLTVVTGLPRADRWVEIRAGVVEHLVEVAQGHGHVVVDTGFSLEDDPVGDYATRPGRNQLTLGALAVADEVVVVGSGDPVGLSRLARGLVELRDRLGGAPVRVVVNRMRPSLGWSERDIVGMVEGFTRLSGIHFLPDDGPTADQALVAGTTVVELGDSPLARQLGAVVDAVVPASVAQPHRRERRMRVRPRRSS